MTATRWPVFAALFAAGLAIAACSASTTSTSTPTTTATVTTSSRQDTSSVGSTAPKPSGSGTVIEGGSTTEDPFAPPSKVFTAKDTSIGVATGDRFGIDLPQDPSAGSWSFTQKVGPVQLLSGGSKINDDGTEVQSFILKANQPGSMQYTFDYSGGHPPGVPTTLDITITVT